MTDPVDAIVSSVAADLRRRAEGLAYALGISLYLAPDGTISQTGPGELIDPGPRSRPLEGGHGKYADVKAAS